MFFTEGRHSDRSAVGLTGSYETLQIDQAEVRTKCANSILVRRSTRRDTSVKQKGRGLTAETHKENYNGKWFHGSNFLGTAVIRY